MDLVTDLQRRFVMRLLAGRTGSAVLRHFTTPEGFEGIIRSGVVRGTSAAFTNDRSEITYGYGVCRAVIAAELASRGEPADRRLLSRIDLGDEPPWQVFIASFSAADETDVGQWRGYGQRGRTKYCIAFEARRFSERDFLQFPIPVIYDRTEQERTIREAIAIACDLFRQLGGDNAAEWSTAVQLTIELRQLSFLLKDKAFAAEREWRSALSIRDFGRLELLDFNPDEHGWMKPTTPLLRGSSETERLPVVKVTLLDRERRPAVIQATKLFLDKCGYPVDPRFSDSPYVD